MTSIKEIILGIITTSQERIKNPFISSFMIAWLVTNWQATFIILFSNTTIEERIGIVTVEEYCSWKSLLWIPLFFALFYNLILPYLLLILDYLSSFAREGRNKRNEDEIYRGLVRKAKLLEKEFENEQIRAGKQELEELNNNVTMLQNNLIKKTAELDSTINEFVKLKAKNESLEKTLEENAQFLDKLSLEQQSNKSKNEALINEKNNLEKQFQIATQELSINKDIANRLNSEVKSLSAKIKERDLKNAELLGELGAEKDMYKAEIEDQKKSKTEHARLIKLYNELQSMIAKSTEEIKEKNKRIDDLQNVIQVLRK